MGNTEAVSSMRYAMRDIQQPPKAPLAIRVENVKAVNRGSLRAFCTVAIGGLKIHSGRSSRKKVRHRAAHALWKRIHELRPDVQ